MPKEFDIINYFRSQDCGQGQYIEKGPGDDMAVMNFNGNRVLVTTDMLLEGVHFDLSTATLTQVGYKAMACSLSDCAAMASTPVGAVGSISLPKHFDMDQITQLHKGLREASKTWNCPIIGGDMTSWDKELTITVTMFSTMTEGRQPVYRSGAKIGDIIMTTGLLGGSIKGRHLTFTPRISESLWLSKHAQIHAMMDLSDGIGGDLRHICQESQVSAIIDYDNLPCSQAALTYNDPGLHALTDGEDFELLFTVSPQDSEKLLKLWPEFSSLPLTPIGKIIEKSNCQILLNKDGKTEELTRFGFQH